ncbi:MAG: 6,7-dimethyl-8-ribityllumazine synthase [Gammaproteobacteria bacterium]|nr:6,7-dimethyl-8-ribityllumazine synthase [Gammaproteobacteria bacterium]
MNYIKAKATSDNTFPIAIVVSVFNRKVTQALQDGALEALTKAGFSSEAITVVEVPGAVEIPLVAKALAKKNKYSAILALGAVIRGETSQYDYVCEQVSRGCQDVTLAFDTPVIFGVLTTENEAQAWDRLGGAHGHKGHDAVEAALVMVQVLAAIRQTQ